MPHDRPDETDPMMLVGVELPADASALEETAAVFAQEFAAMGFDEERILRIFTDPFYAGPHRAWRALGDERTRQIVRENASVWTSVRFRDRDAIPDTSVIPLPVLDPSDNRPRGGRAGSANASEKEE